MRGRFAQDHLFLRIIWSKPRPGGCYVSNSCDRLQEIIHMQIVQGRVFILSIGFANPRNTARSCGNL